LAGGLHAKAIMIFPDAKPTDDDLHLAALADAVDSARLRDASIARIMTPEVATCRREDTLERAAQLMWERACGCLPVVDVSGRPVAMVTDRDICMAAYTQGERLAAMTVESAMSKRLFVAELGESLADAERRMRCHGLHRLPVVDRDGHLAGVLSIDDIARAARLDPSPHPDPLSASALAHTAAGIAHASR
jgi:CBS domain-containing protein